MAALKIELRGNDLFCLGMAADGASARRPLADDTLKRLHDWAAREIAFEVAVAGTACTAP